MNTIFSKAYRTTPSEDLCNLKGTTPIIIKAEEEAKRYNVLKRRRANIQKIDREVVLNQWPHPVHFIKIPETKGCQDETFRFYTDGSKGERGVGAGVVIIVNKELLTPNKFILNHRCSNNQAEKLAIFKALDLINYLEIADNKPRTIGVHIDSTITTDCLKNASKHNYIMKKSRVG